MWDFLFWPWTWHNTSLIIQRLARNRPPSSIESQSDDFSTCGWRGKKNLSSWAKVTSWSNNVMREWQSPLDCWSANGPTMEYTAMWVFVSAFWLFKAIFSLVFNVGEWCTYEYFTFSLASSSRNSLPWGCRIVRNSKLVKGPRSIGEMFSFNYYLSIYLTLFL